MIGRRLADPITQIKRVTIDLTGGRPIVPRELHVTEADEVMNALSRTSALIASRTARLQESEERSREQVRQIDTLMHELAHRNKNQLSVISAMARQLGGSSCDSVSEFQEKFVQRISAMAEAQNLLSQAVVSGVSLQLLLDNQVKPFASENSPQITASGSETFLTAEAARAIGMAFHELATNATKYGALRQPDGRVTVTWSILPDRKLRIVWRENGVPKLPAPERSGFGSVIVEKYVARTLNADVTYTFEDSGIVWTLEAADILA